MKRKQKAVLLPDGLAVRRCSQGVRVFGCVGNDPGQEDPYASSMVLSPAVMAALLAFWRDGARLYSDGAVADVLQELVEHRITLFEAESAIDALMADAADNAIAGWVMEDEAESANEIAWARDNLAAEDATRLSFEEWAEIHGNDRGQSDAQ